MLPGRNGATSSQDKTVNFLRRSNIMWLLKGSKWDAQPGCWSLWGLCGLKTLIVICESWGPNYRWNPPLACRVLGREPRCGRQCCIPKRVTLSQYLFIHSHDISQVCACVRLRQVWYITHKKECKGQKLCTWAQLSRGCIRRETELGDINLLISPPHWAEGPHLHCRSSNISQLHPGVHL